MKLRVAGLATALCALMAAHCGGNTVPLGGGRPESQSGGTNTGADGGAISDDPTFDDPGFPTLETASKVDILLAVDNSAGMARKHEYFARSLSAFVQHVAAVTPDIHLGVITSSLGSFGGDVCDPSNPAKSSRARLQSKDRDGASVTPNGVLVLSSAAGVPSFVSAAERLVLGVGEQGCGLEAQLESVYRFLVQVDPPDEVKLDAFRQGDLGNGIDVDVLRDRAAFLRPDSLVVVLMVTDEEDSSPDPLSIGGFGYAFANRDFPGSKVRRGTAIQGTTAPRGTSVCASDPGAEACTSCGFAQNCDASTLSCQKLKQDPNCTTSGDPLSTGIGYDGFYGPSDDDLNVRFHRMKERFGVDPQFPVDRYVAGLSASSTGRRDEEHVTTVSASGQRQIANYTYRKRCTNPLFASQLPSQVGDELCSLPRGVRSPELVVFGVIAGAPPELVERPDVDWTKLLGRDPEHFDYDGIDPHMVASIQPRAGLLSGGDPDAPRGDNGSDPITGREWNTHGKDLQYACTFQLPAPVSCSAATGDCDCADDPARPGVPASNAPLCATDGSATQTWDKAYPSTRELSVAKKLGTRAMVGSICPRPGQLAYTEFMERFEGVVLPRLHP
ncbi:MAG: hypothetical protein U0270_29335 [Labilithrix sp.]